MKKSYTYTIIAVIVAVVLAVGIVTTLATPDYGIVKGKIFDELSGDAVRGVRIVCDGRSTTLYQTTDYKLTQIPPGTYTLQTSPSSGWIKFTREVKVEPGVNEVKIPLRGDKIPNLTGIICFAEPKKEGIVIEVRYTNQEGVGMTEFPQLPIDIKVTLWERVEAEGKGEEEKENFKKGKKLFEGQVEHFWDSEAYLAKNKALLSWDKIPVNPENKKHGIMEIKVHLEQGDFEDSIDDVKLFPGKEGT